MKRHSFSLIVLLIAAVICLLLASQLYGCNAALSKQFSSLVGKTPLDSLVQVQGSYPVSGPPSLSVGFINRVLSAYHSPATGLGQALSDGGVRYHIDPAYALAFFLHESSFGTTGWGAVNRSLGNIRCSTGYRCQGGYRSYSSWQAGFLDWYQLIRNLYINAWHLTTVAQIIPVYAPARDHNDIRGYIQAVEHAVDTWRSGKVMV